MGWVIFTPPFHSCRTQKPSQIGWVLSCSSHFPPSPENSKPVHYGRVFWLRVTSFTFPHTYSTSITQKTRSKWPGLGCSISYPPYSLSHPKMENTPIWDMFSGFGRVLLYSPVSTTRPEHKKPCPNGWVYGVLPHTPPYPLPHPKMENMPIWDVFSGFGWLRLPFPIHTLPPQPKKPSRKWLDFRLGYCLIPTHFPPPPENSKHVQDGRVFWPRVSSLIFPHTYPTSTTQETEMTGFWVIASSPPISPLTWKLKTHPLRTCFLALDDFVYLPPYTHHLHSRNPVRNDRVLGYCLISHPFPPPTRKLKKCPLWTCCLGLGEFIYFPSYIHHLYNPKNPVQMAGFRVFYLIPPIFSPSPENGKHAPYGRVFWVWMGSFIFPHAYYIFRTQKTQSEWLAFECSASLPHMPSPSRKWKTHPYGTCFLGSAILYILYTPPCIPHGSAQTTWIPHGLRTQTTWIPHRLRVDPHRLHRFPHGLHTDYTSVHTDTIGS